MKKGQKIDKWDKIPLNKAEIDHIIGVCSTIEETYIISMLTYTGCRVNEVLRSRQDWYDYINDMIWIRKKRDEEIDHARNIKTKPKGAKTKKDRVLLLHPELKIAAQNFFESQDMVDRSRAWIYTTVVRLAKEAGVKKKVSPHIFRHSFITLTYEDTTLKSKEIGILAGHKDGSMVENVYTHGENIDVLNKLRREQNES